MVRRHSIQPPAVTRTGLATIIPSVTPQARELAKLKVLTFLLKRQLDRLQSQ